ncbi:MAG: hypothetical protein KAS57_10120 [Gammaproteobacteria bacterium]|nr:hypothetical protein [Gammaproteobacteria bacterium]
MKVQIILLTALLLPLPANATEVSKSYWFNGMSTAIPTAFCNSRQYFRHCFSVSTQQCEEAVASATRICLNKNNKDIPDILVQPKDGAHWGAIIGKCVGDTYEITQEQKHINNAKCNDISKWQ